MQGTTLNASMSLSGTLKPGPKSSSMTSLALAAATTASAGVATAEDNPAEWLFLPETMHRRNLSHNALSSMQQAAVDPLPVTVCQVNDMITNFCINRTNQDCIAVTNGKKIWEFEVSKTAVASFVEDNPMRDPREFEDDGSVHEGSVTMTKSYDDLPVTQSRPTSVFIDSRKVSADASPRSSIYDNRPGDPGQVVRFFFFFFSSKIL